jgi:HPt (histidine-containing phosphotransfer) domain-containing protein
MERPATLEGRLLDLKHRFVRTMPDRIAAIASTLNDCASGGKEPNERLQRQFHTLAGTAGTYALNAVAAAAFEGEEACAELGDSPPASDAFSYLSFLVDQLYGALAVDAPAQWRARTILTAASPPPAAAQLGVSAA